MKSLKNIVLFSVSFTIAALAGSASAKHLSEKSTKERIKPVHSVYVEGDEVPVVANAAPVAAVAAGPRTAESIYTASCAGCHATGAAGAPKLGDVADWATRSEKGLEVVYANAIDGFNIMPPRGTCADCSDEELKEVVDYMLANSK